jgi:hypothetical protein
MLENGDTQTLTFQDEIAAGLVIDQRPVEQQVDLNR